MRGKLTTLFCILRPLFLIPFWLLLCLFLIAPVDLSAQTPTAAVQHDWFGATFNWNDFASPRLSGTLGYGKLLSATTGTYWFTTVDVSPTNTHPRALQTAVTTGVAQHIYTLFKFQLYAAGTFGPVAVGSSVGGGYTARALLVRPLAIRWHGKTNTNFAALVFAGAVGSTVSPIEPAVGLGFGYQH